MENDSRNSRNDESWCENEKQQSIGFYRQMVAIHIGPFSFNVFTTRLIRFSVAFHKNQLKFGFHLYCIGVCGGVNRTTYYMWIKSIWLARSNIWYNKYNSPCSILIAKWWKRTWRGILLDNCELIWSILINNENDYEQLFFVSFNFHSWRIQKNNISDAYCHIFFISFITFDAIKSIEFYSIRNQACIHIKCITIFRMKYESDDVTSLPYSIFISKMWIILIYQ